MAEVVENFPVLYRSRTNGYDWKQLFDGQAWKLEAGEDFHCKMQSFRCQVFNAAKKRALKVVTRIDGDSIYLQAFDLEGGPIGEKSSAKAKK
jgi:hypothetical protein